MGEGGCQLRDSGCKVGENEQQGLGVPLPIQEVQTQLVTASWVGGSVLEIILPVPFPSPLGLPPALGPKHLRCTNHRS